MATLSKQYLQFDEDDVKLMQQLMKQFHDLHKGVGMPDYSNSYVGYLPVFAISMIACQEATDRVNRRLVCLTWLVAGLTFVLIGLTVALFFVEGS